jgi:O-antigen ligase
LCHGDIIMTIQDISSKEISEGPQKVFLILIGLWSASQLLSVFNFLPAMVLYILHNSKNIIGAIIVAWSLLVVLTQLSQNRGIQFDKSIFVYALLFPFYVTIVNIVRLDISWREVLLYWFWVTGVYLTFPAMLQSEHIRRQAIKVLFWTNFLILLIGISLGVLKGQYYVIGHGERMVFSFFHPNYYSNSWLIVFALSCYFALTVKRNVTKIIFGLLMLVSILFMILAGSRNTLAASIIMITCYMLFYKRWSFLSKFTAIFLTAAIIILSLLFINPSAGKIDQITTGRLSLWRMTLEANINRASALDYLLGFGKYEIKGFSYEPSKTYSTPELTRYHMDNAYLDILLQTGLVGGSLFFIPLVVLMRRTRLNAVAAGDDHDSRQARLALGCWGGILVQMTTASVIPSFGNVINIFILVFMAPMALKIKPVQPDSVEGAASRLSPLGSVER